MNSLYADRSCCEAEQKSFLCVITSIIILRSVRVRGALCLPTWGFLCEFIVRRPFGFVGIYRPTWTPFTSDPEEYYGFENQVGGGNQLAIMSWPERSLQIKHRFWLWTSRTPRCVHIISSVFAMLVTLLTMLRLGVGPRVGESTGVGFLRSQRQCTTTWLC